MTSPRNAMEIEIRTPQFLRQNFNDQSTIRLSREAGTGFMEMLKSSSFGSLIRTSTKPEYQLHIFVLNFFFPLLDVIYVPVASSNASLNSGSDSDLLICSWRAVISAIRPAFSALRCAFSVSSSAIRSISRCLSDDANGSLTVFSLVIDDSFGFGFISLG